MLESMGTVTVGIQSSMHRSVQGNDEDVVQIPSQQEQGRQGYGSKQELEEGCMWICRYHTIPSK